MTETSFEDFLSTYPPEVRELAHETRKLVLSVIPQAVEMIDPPSKIIAYGLGRKYADLVCAIQPYQSYLNLVLSKGATLEDPDHLLTGTGKRARHVKIKHSADLRHPGVRRLIEQSLTMMSQ